MTVCFRHFPVRAKHPRAWAAACAAEAAHLQGAFWALHDRLFARQERLDDAALRAYAAELGLDGDRVIGAAAQPFGDKVEADFAAGLAAGVGGTPTVFVDGRLFDGRMELGALRRAVSGVGSGGDGRLDPGARRQRRWPLRLRRAQREPLTEDPQQDDPEHRCQH